MWEGGRNRSGVGGYVYSEPCGSLLPQGTERRSLGDLLRLRLCDWRARLMGD